MKQGLSLRVSQHLALTPQLQQSIRLLQLSTLDLAQEVDQALDENPFLERADDEFGADDNGLPTPAERASPTPERESAAAGDAEGGDAEGGDGAATSDFEAEANWDGDGSVEFSPDDGEWGGEAPAARVGGGEDDELDAGERGGPGESLHEHLHRQALALRQSPEDAAALYVLIESLDDDGYLADPLHELVESFEPDDDDQRDELRQRFDIALHLLQSLEPTGVGARDLAECLTLQIDAWLHDAPDDADARLARLICQQPMDWLARRDWRKLAPACGAPEAEVRSALAFITRLEPKPGRRFVDVTRDVVLPDVIVSAVRGRGAQPRFVVRLNPDVMPRLRVNDLYANALRGGKGESHQALSQRLQEARWFIKNIQQRFDTILRVASAIVERQKAFFVHGELAMQPLVLREIADEIGMHESTISRVTSGKYMATPWGTFELKYFFGSALGTEAGGNASSTAVRALIKQFVAAEDPARPLSDSQLSEMLKEQGIECARRTVAKYREAMKIAPTNLRRAL